MLPKASRRPSTSRSSTSPEPGDDDGPDESGQRLEVGRIGRATGLRGDVSMILTTNRTERTEPGAVLYAGERLLVIETSRTHSNRVIVHFEGVDDRDAAEALRGELLSADPLVDQSDDVLWVHELIGSVVHDPKGTPLGTVTSVQANPAHDLLVLESGALVPAVFIVDHEPGRVVVDLPDGLLET